MKDYQEVVSERFDKQDGDKPSIYSADQPIGIYSRKNLFAALDRCLEYTRMLKGNLAKMRLVDVGCGNGEMLDTLVQKGFMAEHAQGFDLSSGRINYAAERYPAYTFQVADITQQLPLEQKADFIAAFDLFSHLRTESQLLAGLNSVNSSLEAEGQFLWFDIASADHFAAPAHVDTWGFSKAQMQELAAKAGFKAVYYDSIFRTFFNRYHSLYQAKRIPHGVLRLLEKVLPGRPGNHLFLFEKK